MIINYYLRIIYESWRIMNIIVHLPEILEGMELLSGRLNEARLTMVANNINKLSCLYEQKVELFEHVCEEIASRQFKQ